MRQKIIHKILNKKLIAIIRGIEKDACLKLAESLYVGGIELMEVTFNQKQPQLFIDTAATISAINKSFHGKVFVGAGTVTTPELVDIAADAGAKYIISPDTNEKVIQRTLERGLVSIPGALTPTEIMKAHNAGADFVKLFPSSTMGTDYIKAILAPISHVNLLVVGGVNENNIADFLQIGVCGAGIGGNLVNRKWIDNNEFDKITALAKKYVQLISQ